MVRQLTAIMFTDMVGYTALMQEDEGLARLSRDRQRHVLEEEIAHHDGRILQHYGDGSLTVFRSAFAAVQCAVDIQTSLREEPPVPLRIGIHTGDVVHDDDGVFGDGVNVAARIQGLAAPGGILISGKVFDEVKNHPEIKTKSLGAFQLKHVKHPMKVFAIANEGLAVPSEADVVTGRVSHSHSVAVLPFLNISNEPDKEFFSDGITEEIINALTQVNGLKVTARTSSFAFKNQHQDIRAIAERLGVTHVLEGSVRHADSRVRVTAQLICASDGYHVFSESYDRSVEDIFAVQDEIARVIVEKLARHLRPVRTAEREPAHDVGDSHDADAYAEYLRGRFEWARFSPEGVRRAIRHFERSVQLDPACALPHTGLAAAYVFLGAIGHLPADEAYPKAEASALEGLRLEPNAGESHVALASVKFIYRWDFDGAYTSFQKALSLTPGSAEAHHLYGMYLKVIRETDEAIEETRAAVHLDPLSPSYNNSLAQCLALAGRMRDAYEQIRHTIDLDPQFRNALETLGWYHVLEGDHGSALAAFEQIPGKAGHSYAAAGARGYCYGMLGRVEEALRMRTLLEQRGRAQPHVTLEADFALIHEGLGEREEALEHLGRAVDRRMGSMVFLHTFAPWRNAHSDPRFQALLDRIGIPRPVAA